MYHSRKIHTQKGLHLMQDLKWKMTKLLHLLTNVPPKKNLRNNERQAKKGLKQRKQNQKELRWRQNFEQDKQEKHEKDTRKLT